MKTELWLFVDLIFPSWLSILCIGYAAAQKRQYSRLMKQMKPDLAEYQEQKEKL